MRHMHLIVPVTGITKLRTNRRCSSNRNCLGSIRKVMCTLRSTERTTSRQTVPVSKNIIYNTIHGDHATRLEPDTSLPAQTHYQTRKNQPTFHPISMKSPIQGDSFQLIRHNPRHINVITFQDTLNQTCRINGDGGSVTSWPYVVKHHRGHQLSLLRQLTTSKSLWQPNLSQSIGETRPANSLPNALCIPISSIQPGMVLTLFYQSKRVIQKIKNSLFAKINGLTSHPCFKRVSFST